MIRIRRNDDQTGYVCIIEDDGLSVSREPFGTFDELQTILKPKSDDDETYVEGMITSSVTGWILGLRRPRDGIR